MAFRITWRYLVYHSLCSSQTLNSIVWHGLAWLGPSLSHLISISESYSNAPFPHAPLFLSISSTSMCHYEREVYTCPLWAVCSVVSYWRFVKSTQTHSSCTCFMRLCHEPKTFKLQWRRGKLLYLILFDALLPFQCKVC